MKNLFRMIEIIAIVAIIGFGFTACDQDGDNNNNNNNSNNNNNNKPSNPKATVAASFMFRNAATNAAVSPSASIRSARSVTGPGGATYEVDTASFADYDWFYTTWLGGDTKKVGTGITPTKFEIPVFFLRLEGDGIEAELIGSIYGNDDGSYDLTMVDFAQGVTIKLDNIEPGTYKVVDFRFWFDKTKVSFPLPTAVNDYAENPSFMLRSSDYYEFPITHTNNGGIITITTPLSLLNPAKIEPATSGGGGYTPRLTPTGHMFNGLFFWGNTYKLFAQDANMSCHIKVPFEPVVIPEGATSVTFEIRWDLNNIIQQYTGRNYLRTENNKPVWGVTDVANDGDDIFVLKNKFWEGFSITAAVVN